MTSRTVIALFSVLALAPRPILAEAPSPAPRPNILILLSDDAGYHEFSMHGAKKIPTPRIDSIARNGVRFTNGYVSGCVCSPTRAGLLTGRYQQRFGHEFNIPPVYSETNGLPLSETLLPAVLKPAGYRTIALGKWHLGYAPAFHPLERGFTDYYGFLQGARSYFPLPDAGRLNRMLRDREPVPEKFDYMTDHLAAEAVKYIEGSKDKPFFMYLAFNATHGPSQATGADLKRAGGNKIAAMTLALDRAVGTVLDALKREGILDRTLVLFLNDNGGAAGHDNAPLNGHKGSCWEGGIRVPFVMQWPGRIPAGQVIHTPVIGLDLFPTALAAAGIARTTGKPLDGVDLLPLVAGEKAPPPSRPLFWKSGAAWAVREGDLKLVVPQGKSPSPPLLFNLAEDPGETRNLAEERKEDVVRLRSLYDEWKSTHQPTPWRGEDQKAEKEEKAGKQGRGNN